MKDLRNYLKPNEIEMMLDKANSLRDYLIIRLLWKTGVRVSELINIEVDWIDFEEKMLVSKAATENIGDAQGAKEIVPGNKEKWRSRLDSATTLKIEKICRDQLISYGYPTSYDGPIIRIHPLKMTLLRVLDGVNLVLHDNEKRGVIQNTILHLRHVKHMGKTR